MDAVRRTNGVIEIAGPAGSGKSTLFDALSVRRPIHIGVRPFDRACVPLALRLLRHLPAGYMWGELRRGRIPREPLQSMVYLESWLRQLSGPEYLDSAPVLYDHGPFFRLATIQEFGPPAGAGLRVWWNSMREAWSGTMTLVVWLDAPDPVLLARIRERNRGHPCETMNDDEALAWLARYRTAFESALEVFRRLRPDDMVRFDTSSMSPDDIAASLAWRIETSRG